MAKGTPLSVRIRLGRPNSWKRRLKTGFELALEIGGPEIVGREDGGGGLSRMADASAPTADGNHAVSF